MQGLKVLVIGMGVAIAMMITVIITTMANRAMTAPESLPRFDPRTVEVPPGARIVGTSVGDGRIVVHLVFDNRPARLLVIDLASGRDLGAIDLVKKP
ncbi:MAG: hypothetical protein O3B21_16555 [Proteobacteria bacterium]|nr:hypothetical protein [Pseudomonadota bacterium]